MNRMDGMPSQQTHLEQTGSCCDELRLVCGQVTTECCPPKVCLHSNKHTPYVKLLNTA